MPRKTDSSNSADWIPIVESDMEVLRPGIGNQWGFAVCRSKLAEVVEKIVKAELIRLGWPLEKTHDLVQLHDRLVEWKSELESLAAPLCLELAQAYFCDRYPGFDREDPDWPKVAGPVGPC